MKKWITILVSQFAFVIGAQAQTSEQPLSGEVNCNFTDSGYEDMSLVMRAQYGVGKVSVYENGNLTLEILSTFNIRYLAPDYITESIPVPSVRATRPQGVSGSYMMELFLSPPLINNTFDFNPNQHATGHIAVGDQSKMFRAFGAIECTGTLTTR